MTIDARKASMRLIWEGDAYAEHGVFQRGDRAASKLLDGFSVSVDEVLDAK